MLLPISIPILYPAHLGAHVMRYHPIRVVYDSPDAKPRVVGIIPSPCCVLLSSTRP